jgi:hypothetical protein
LVTGRGYGDYFARTAMEWPRSDLDDRLLRCSGRWPGQTEQVDEAAGVAVGRVGFAEDTVLADSAAGEPVAGDQPIQR